MRELFERFRIGIGLLLGGGTLWLGVSLEDRILLALAAVMLPAASYSIIGFRFRLRGLRWVRRALKAAIAFYALAIAISQPWPELGPVATYAAVVVLAIAAVWLQPPRDDNRIPPIKL